MQHHCDGVDHFYLHGGDNGFERVYLLPSPILFLDTSQFLGSLAILQICNILWGWYISYKHMKHKAKFHHRLVMKLYDTDEHQPKMEGIIDIQNLW